MKKKLKGILVGLFTTEISKNKEIAKIVCMNTVKDCEQSLRDSIERLGTMENWGAVRERVLYQFNRRCIGPSKNDHFEKIPFSRYYKLAKETVAQKKRKWQEHIAIGTTFIFFFISLHFIFDKILFTIPALVAIIAWLVACMMDNILLNFTATDYQDACSLPIQFIGDFLFEHIGTVFDFSEDAMIFLASWIFYPFQLAIPAIISFVSACVAAYPLVFALVAAILIILLLTFFIYKTHCENER